MTMLRILFVDDDRMVLTALKRRLHAMRNRWEMTFVLSGQEALDTLATEPFDVLVTDMRMPGMDGATLLTEVQKHHEGVVRIVLSGYSEESHVARAVHVAHQFLSKPCDPNVLETTVERTCALRDRLRAPALLRIVGKIDRLPPVPKTYSALLDELANPNSSAASVAAIIARDSAMSAKLLQLVSSAFFVSSAQVRSIPEAVMRLGFEAVRDLCLGMGVFCQDSSLSARALEHHQRHAITTAQLAAACFEDRAPSQEAFLAGMLHDIGELILAGSMPRVWRQLNHGCGNAAERRAREVATLGASHEDVGAYLLGIWGLPYSVVSAVAHHQRPSEEVGGEALTLAIHAADAVANAGSVAGAEALLDPDLSDAARQTVMAMLARIGKSRLEAA